MAGRKVFVGSLPFQISEAALRAEFGKFGQVEEVFVKVGCEPDRQWAFVTFASPDQAQFAKEACDRILTFPGASRPCDVMIAKTQMGGTTSPPPVPQQCCPGYGAPNGGAGPYGAPPPQAYPQQTGAAAVHARKIFVGSLPDDITEGLLGEEFSKYGHIEEIFIKPGCESGRQWAFITFSTPDQAVHATQMTNGTLQFRGSLRPCEVKPARNQGMFGQEPLAASPPPGVAFPPPANYGPPATFAPAPQAAAQAGPRKIFVGSLPDGITDQMLRSEFSRYGQITDLFLKTGCESGRQWAFITFDAPQQAQHAKESCDRALVFPGADRPCEVTIARHQGLFGQDSPGSPPPGYAPMAPYQQVAALETPRKVFVGSLPDGVHESVLMQEFSKYGQVMEVFVKAGCEPGRQWGFVTFATGEQAQYAKEATDRILALPGTDKPLDVKLAKNQGKFGQQSSEGGNGMRPGPMDTSQPPPPAAPPPAHLTTWRMYKTATGLPYYHNAATGVTQWECPPELQVPGQRDPYTMGAANAQRYSPY